MYRSFTSAATGSVARTARPHFFAGGACCAPRRSRRSVVERFLLPPAPRTVLVQHVPPSFRSREVLLRVERIAAWLDEVGDVDRTTGNIRPAVDLLRRFRVTANQLRASVGLDPLSRAVLAVDELHARRSAVDLAAADLEAGRRLREGRRGG